MFPKVQMRYSVFLCATKVGVSKRQITIRGLFFLKQLKENQAPAYAICSILAQKNTKSYV